MLNPQTLPNGGEQYETYTPAIRKARKRVQYDYRHTDGELFSCVKKTLDECRVARDHWIETRTVTPRVVHMPFTQEMADILGIELDEIKHYRSGDAVYVNTKHWDFKKQGRKC